MAVNYQPDLSGVERKIEEGVRQLKKLEWYQRPLGIFLLGFFSGVFSSIIVALLLRFL